jgi:hypothetical protein
MTRVASNRDLRNAVLQTLRENSTEVRDVLAEVFEDVALANAIRQGQKSRRVTREKVMKALTAKR